MTSRRLDLVFAAAAWVAGFAWVGFRGSWAPLAALAAAAAARLLLVDATTRRLLAPRASALALAAVGTVAMVAATYLGYPLAARLAPGLPAATADLYRVLHAGGYSPASLTALVLAVSACEEIVWRGALLEGADALAGTRALRWPAVGRVATCALLYGACHLGSGSPLLALLAAGCGLAWGLLRVAGRSLWPSILTHAAWDLAVLVAWPLAA